MVLPKKKVISRKRAIDLDSANDSNSPPRSSWQAKYKELLPADSPKSHNGTPDGISSASGGLVGDYDSSSESDSESSREPKKEPETACSAPKAVATSETNGAPCQLPGSPWIECVDKVSKYPYYWNHLTNQVTWQPPPEYVAMQLMRKQEALAGATVPATEKKNAGKLAPSAAKSTKKYPWDGNSDSDEDRPDRPPSTDESDKQPRIFALDRKKAPSKKASDSRLPPTGDEHHDIYETSSLMTPLVPDTGPPGAEPAAANGAVETNRGEKVISDLELADRILAEIEKEVPPDFVKSMSRRPSTETKASTSFALIASYGDDSDQEEVNDSPPKPPCLFPSVSQGPPATVVPKALFPSAVETPTEVKSVLPVVNSEVPRRELLVSNSPPAVLDPSLPDSSMTFKRKRRIEFAPAVRTEIAPKTDVMKPSEPTPDYAPVTEPNTRYNMEPGAGERRGFGFSQSEQKSAGEKKGSGIQFVKAETLAFQPSLDATKSQKENSPIPSQDLVDGAALLKEKLTFLGEGSEEVSAVQRMAIQLETLVSAWQSGALTPTYLSQWLGSLAVELSKNEQAAPPPGWTCEWERDAKRYCYRNMTTGVLVWDYPDENQIEPGKSTMDSVQDEVEMELSNTPPRLSPDELDAASDPVPPPPPDISRSVTPPPPPAPIITKSHLSKKHSEEVTSSSEDIRNIPPPPPPPEENYPPPPPPPPEPDQPPPPGVVDGSRKSRLGQPPLPRHPHPDSSTNGSSSANDLSASLPKRCLTSELDSFYMDLAKLSGPDTVSGEADNPKPSVSVSEISKKTQSSAKPAKPPLPPENPVKILKHSSPPPQSLSSPIQDMTSRKRKKGKLAPGLTLKKKGVSSLVAKWQQVQEEARKDYSSDEDNDDVSTTQD